MLSDSDLLRAEGAEATAASQPGSPPATSLPSAVAIDLVPGTTDRQRSGLVRRITSANPDRTPGGTYEFGRVRGAVVANASGMGSQPLALALGLAAAAVLSLALTVLASVRRQRRELALLKTLGMTRRQLRSIVAWQTSVILVVTAVVSVPLGIAAGRWAWEAPAGAASWHHGDGPFTGPHQPDRQRADQPVASLRGRPDDDRVGADLVRDAAQLHERVAAGGDEGHRDSQLPGYLCSPAAHVVGNLVECVALRNNDTSAPRSRRGQ
jgi:hypothetical protein